uniref:NADH dehydrogenase subunit 1 n=1 Tax=Abia mengmeng TaxID=2798524 RepID=UPI002237E502|nr:NADH dehydrogenase subunit 1 [Abia mengmeng]UYK52130.1 NADH dehydrogenase subunit 1 [Abia mengmeng]
MNLSDLVLGCLSSLILIIMVLVGVAFLTLFERKVLGYVQFRKGPNKVSITGVMQPFCDAIKLFSKEQVTPFSSNYYPYYFSPIFSLFLSLILWLVMPYFTNMYSFDLGVLFLLCCMSVSVYSIMISGWSSNSKYSVLGGLRSVAQTISYEVSMVIIFLFFLTLIESFGLSDFCKYQTHWCFVFISFPLSLIWLIISLAETSRTPFDFSEGESELVSGFNVEYGSGGFALIFMAEYASILFMSMLFGLMFLGANLYSLFFYMEVIFISYLIILIRGTLPRLRYDKLMMMAWKSFLPVSLNYLIFIIMIKFFIYLLLL